MTRRHEPDLLVLRCNAAPDRCRWRPPGDLDMRLVQAHFDMEDGHDPEHIRLELVAWCRRCDVEMNLFRSLDLGQGTVRRWYLCGICRRTRSVVQGPGEGV